MPSGGTLTISATFWVIGARHRSDARLGSYVRLSVTDTGIDMDEVTLVRALKPFFSTKGAKALGLTCHRYTAWSLSSVVP